MKKIISLFLVVLILAPCFSVLTSAVDNEVDVVLNGFQVIFDVPGRLMDGRTMVPLRKIGEALGATVEWDGATRGIKLTRGDNIIELAIDSYDLYKNGVLTYKMDVAPVIIEEEGASRTLVPLRAISEAFGCLVEWEGTTRTALIADIPDSAVMNVGPFPVTNDLFSYFAVQTISGLSNIEDIESDSEEITVVQNKIIEEIAYFNSIKSYASELGLSIYDPAISDAVQASIEEYKQYYGEIFSYILLSSNMTEEVFTEILYASYFETKLLEAITALSDTLQTSDKADAMMEDDDFIRAAHILLEDEDSAKSISEIAKSATNEEFFELMKNYSKDTGITEYPYGYYFGRDQMVKSFEDAAFALNVGETSDIIKSEFGYHIIRRLEKDQPYLYENADLVFSDYINYKFYSDLGVIAESLVEACVYFPLYEKIDLYNDYILPIQETIKNSAAESDSDQNEESDIPNVTVDDY